MVHKRKNPWLGLESYKENQIIYGRNAEIGDLSQRVLNDTDTVVYGKSGIGKTSIINAGILPVARQNEFVPIVIRLDHSNTTSYIKQLDGYIRKNVEVEEVAPAKNDGKELLWEYFHRHKFFVDGKRIKLLLVFDQFEEIFTLQQNSIARFEFFRTFGDVLNGMMPKELAGNPENKKSNIQEVFGEQVEGFASMAGIFNDVDGDMSAETQYVDDNTIHFVFVLREDFLSEFEYYTTKIPSLKQHRFALRPLNEEQAAEIIMKPCPGLVSMEVAHQIIETVTGRNDFSLGDEPEIEVDAAVLSLFLSRIYQKLDDEEEVISSHLINQFGADIIKDFYAESIENLTNEEVNLLEDRLLTSSGRRNNVSYSDFCHFIDKEKVNELIWNKKLLRTFNYGNDIRIEFIHDILCPIVKERKEKREQIKRQEEENARAEAERQKILKQQRRERKRFRRTLFWSFGIIVTIVSAWLFNAYWNQWEYEEYYQGFTRQNGWPIGVGEQVKEKDIKARSVCYKLVREGRNPSKPFTFVEICSPNGKVFLNKIWQPIIGSNNAKDDKANQFITLNQEVRYIHFSGESNSAASNVSRESYYGKNKQLLYGINYYRNAEENDSNKTNTSFWAVYVDANGIPLKVHDNGADRMKVFLSYNTDKSKDKLETKYMFYDEKASPQQNGNGCYGYRVTYNDNYTIDSLFQLDPFTFERIVEVYNYTPNQTITSIFSCVTMRPYMYEKLGYAKMVATHDRHGNIIEKKFYDEKGLPVGGIANHAKMTILYDKFNRIVEIYYYNKENKKNRWEHYEYDGLSNTYSNIKKYEVQNGQNKLVYLKSIAVRGNVTDYIEDNCAIGLYRHEQVMKDNKTNLVTYSYLNREGKLIFDSIKQCARYTEKTIALGDKKASVIKYYGIDGQLYCDINNPEIEAIDSACYDKDGLKRSEVTFDTKGNVIKSMGYDYKDGVEVARYALSLDGRSPIRCATWEIDGLCYYKLNNVKNARSKFNLAYIKAVSEYSGCYSYIYFPGKFEPVKYEFEPETILLGENWQQQTRTSIVIPPLPTEAHYVEYIHILSLNKLAYKLGVRDGDLLLEEKNVSFGKISMRVLRYHPENNSWEKLKSIIISKDDNGMEHYPVAYTKDEYNEYLKGMK